MMDLADKKESNTVELKHTCCVEPKPEASGYPRGTAAWCWGRIGGVTPSKDQRAGPETNTHARPTVKTMSPSRIRRRISLPLYRMPTSAKSTDRAATQSTRHGRASRRTCKLLQHVWNNKRAATCWSVVWRHPLLWQNICPEDGAQLVYSPQRGASKVQRRENRA
jgi:hypothetical protein